MVMVSLGRLKEQKAPTWKLKEKKSNYPGNKEFQSRARLSILLLSPMLSIYPDEGKGKKEMTKEEAV